MGSPCSRGWGCCPGLVLSTGRSSGVWTVPSLGLCELPLGAERGQAARGARGPWGSEGQEEEARLCPASSCAPALGHVTRTQTNWQPSLDVRQ